MAAVSLRPLVPAEEAWLSSELSGGRRPYVHVLAASADLPAGGRARLLSAQPVAEGEYLIVEVKGDRLPFAAPELALPPTIARRVRKAAGVVDPPPKPARRTTKAAPTGVARPTRAAPIASPVTKAPASYGTKVFEATVAPAKTRARADAPAAKAPVAAAARATAPSPVKPGRRRTPTPLTVTITFDGATRWTVEARAGTRRIRAVEISAGAAAAASDALGVPDVDALVSGITDTLRRDAEDRAAGLRSQLAAAEAELARLSR